MSGTDTEDIFRICVEALKQYFTSKSNLTEIVGTNPSPSNCSVYNDVHYGSTLTNH